MRLSLTSVFRYLSALICLATSGIAVEGDPEDAFELQPAEAQYKTERLSLRDRPGVVRSMNIFQNKGGAGSSEKFIHKPLLSLSHPLGDNPAPFLVEDLSDGKKRVTTVIHLSSSDLRQRLHYGIAQKTTKPVEIFSFPIRIMWVVLTDGNSKSAFLDPIGAPYESTNLAGVGDSIVISFDVEFNQIERLTTALKSGTLHLHVRYTYQGANVGFAKADLSAAGDFSLSRSAKSYLTPAQADGSAPIFANHAEEVSAKVKAQLNRTITATNPELIVHLLNSEFLYRIFDQSQTNSYSLEKLKEKFGEKAEDAVIEYLKPLLKKIIDTREKSDTRTTTDQTTKTFSLKGATDKISGAINVEDVSKFEKVAGIKTVYQTETQEYLIVSIEVRVLQSGQQEINLASSDIVSVLKPGRGLVTENPIPAYFLHSQVIVEDTKRTFPCTVCYGAGHVICQICRGAGEMSCLKCQGRGLLLKDDKIVVTNNVICPNCTGAPKIVMAGANNPPRGFKVGHNVMGGVELTCQVCAVRGSLNVTSTIENIQKIIVCSEPQCANGRKPCGNIVSQVACNDGKLACGKCNATGFID